MSKRQARTGGKLVEGQPMFIEWRSSTSVSGALAGRLTEASVGGLDVLCPN